jgi:phosphoribosylformylglycinamidine synthase subunit PurSL
MKKHSILIIASGAREHALGWKLAQSPKVGKIYFAPGSPGTETIGVSTGIAATDFDAQTKFAIENKIDFTVGAPDDILAAGVVDAFQKKGLKIFGASKAAAQIEASKAFAKKLMKEEGIPTAKYETFTDFKKAQKYIQDHSLPIVIKASGLALGKGVIIAQTLGEAEKTLEEIMVKKIFGDSGNEVVIEEFMQGQEVSTHAFSDGEHVALFPTSRDHKPIYEGNLGPNTGGMGTIAPLPEITDKQLEEIKKKIVLPTIKGMKKRGKTFVGCLYPGLMMTKDGPKVVEFNCRFGDPEIESYMRLLETDLFDILNACVEGTLDKQTIKWSKKSACTIALASATYPAGSHKGDIIHGLEKIKDKDIVVFHFGTKKENGQIVTNGGRVLAVTATGKNLDEALDKAYSVIGKNGIHFDGMQVRRDIGRVKVTNQTANRIEVYSKVLDTRADIRKKKIQQEFKNVTNVQIADVYTIDKQFSNEELEKIGSALSNPVTQTTNGKPQKFSYAIEIGFLPGVTDNIATTTRETISDLLKTEFSGEENVYSSQVTFISGIVTQKEATAIAETLYNPLIQSMHIKSYEEFEKDGGMDTIVPKVHLEHKPQTTEVNLNVPDEELTKIGKEGIANADGTRRGPLALDLFYMKTIQNHFKTLKRNPTDIELESLAQTWSEHCKHTIFANPIDEIKEGLYKTYIKGATQEIRKKKGKKDFCVSVFSDNSGAIAFDENWLVTHKAETHNSPSALDPFGGAITGIVGVNRDTLGFGLGAKPVANYYGFCFADPRLDNPLYKGPNFTQKMLSSRRIMDGVIAGVNAGGNQSGIPTPQGFIYFDERFRGKPLVFAGTVGIIPRKIGTKLSHVKKALPGDLIVMVGGRVGKDGIHGATFSSEAMDSGSPVTAVQIGDPITQKKLSDAISKEARDLLLYNSITDNGAGGLSCSVAEMAKESGGCEVTLENIPLKYPGLDPWEIWISESQERMTLAVPAKNIKKFIDLMNRRGVEATVIGTFTKNGKCVVKYNNKIIMDMDLEFLHNGLPKRQLKTTYTKSKNAEPKLSEQSDYSKDVLSMLKRLNITSFSFITQQYDHVVQAGLVLSPLQGRGRVNADASVFRPVLTTNKGVVLSQGMYPTYSDIDTYHMAAASLDTAVRNAVAAGANPDHLAILDNFCWTDSNNPERLGQLKQAVKACFDYAVAYGTPFISGKDSMFNDFKGYDKDGNKTMISIPPTLLISSIGVVDDSTKVVSLDAKIPGDLVYILGDTYDELGGSEYFAMLGDKIGNEVPQVDAEKNKKLYSALYTAIDKELIASSQSVNRGGIAIALSKKAIGGMLGLAVSLKDLPGKTSSATTALFSESQGRIVVTVAPKNKDIFEKIMKGNSFAEIGKVTKEQKIIVTDSKGNQIINVKLDEATESYTETFKDY